MSKTLDSVLIALALAALLATDIDCCKDNYFKFVTFEKCHFTYFRSFDVREYPVDNYAKGLIIDDCRITKLKADELYGLANIEELDLRGNQIEHFNISVLNYAPSLKDLKLSFNKLTKAPVFDDYEVSPRLKSIDLGGNLIADIMDLKTFSNCDRLISLRLHRNKIDQLHPELFKSLEIWSLDLSDNKITHLDNIVFNERLRELFLQGNPIGQLPIGFFSKYKSQPQFFGSFKFGVKPWNCNCLFEVFGADIWKKQDVASKYGFYDNKGSCNGTQPVCVTTGPCEKGEAFSPCVVDT